MNSLKKRFSKEMESKEVVLSCLLGPRYKECPIYPETLNNAQTWLTEEAEKHPDTTPVVSTSDDEEDPKRQTVEDQASSLLDNLYDTVLTSTSHAHKPEGILEELGRYIKDPGIDRKSGNPLNWWKLNSSRFNRLSDRARRYLACPPTSLPSERVFSTVGSIYEEKMSSVLSVLQHQPVELAVLDCGTTEWGM